MDKKSLKEKLTEIIAEELGVDILEVENNFTQEFTSFGADSLRFVELMLSLEEQYDLDIADEETEKLKTPQLVYTYLVKKLKL